MDMDGDWRLPRPNTLFKKHRRFAGPATPEPSIASTFSSLATPVVAEAVQKAKELSATGDAEGFHQLRVAFRKLRALYWAYAPCLGEAVVDEATEEFKRLAAAAGATRDWDIVAGLLDVAQRSNLSISLLVTSVHARRAEALQQSQAQLRSDDVESFLTGALNRAQSALESQNDDLTMRTFAKGRVRVARRTLNKRSRRASRRETVVEEELHDVRKAGKKLRYLLEFFQPVLKANHRQSIRSLTAVQDKLGRFNDLAASEALIRNTEFDDVPLIIVDESLQWLDKQKCRQMRAAARQVKTFAT